MTTQQRLKTPGHFLAAAMRALQTMLRVVSKFALGGLALIAAGVVALTMAVLGLLIAMAALIFRLSARKDKSYGSGTAHHDSESGDRPVTLEARRTGRGWTVE